MNDTGFYIRVAIEILVFAGVIYAFIRFLQETRGSAVLKGFVFAIVLLGLGFITVVKQFGLMHLEYIGNQGLLLFMIGIVVVFQPELRHALVRLGEARFVQRLGRGRSDERAVSDEIVTAVTRLQERGLGAIMLLERRIGIAGYAETGIPVDARVSATLLVTLFFKDTPTHDGAVLVRDGRIAAAACILPLAQDPVLPTHFGTRHRAALGATEENDALAVVVSEETRRVSVAQGGRIEEGVTTDRLRQILLSGSISESPVPAGRAAA